MINDKAISFKIRFKGDEDYIYIYIEGGKIYDEYNKEITEGFTLKDQYVSIEEIKATISRCYLEGKLL